MLSPASLEEPDYRLQLQDDGNLVLVYAASGVPIWATGTDGTGAVSLNMQLDGNLVLYTAGKVPVWASNTAGSGRSLLRVQDDRNVVIYQEYGGPVWATNTTLPRERTVRFPTLMKAGDCEMYNASLFFYSDGTGEFSSSVLTNDSTPLGQTDVWHIRFEVKDRAGNTLFKLPPPTAFGDTYWDSPGMKQHDPNIGTSPPRGDYNFEKPFTFNAALFDQISMASAYSRC